MRVLFTRSPGRGHVTRCVFPEAADQFVNAAAAARSGAGLALQPGEVDAAAVRSAVAALLADSGFATATRRVGEEIAAMPTPVDVGDALHERVRSA
jgi:UDP:flavonoid glycosyltransferase YjiC (YdhE family)